jgi:Tol biopolymer transport system component
VDTGSGSTTLQLTKAPGDDGGPLISPDRRSVVYQHDSGGGTELRVVASDGTGDRPLFGSDIGCPNLGRPAWNPVDPTVLAVACTSGNGSALRLFALDGSVIRELAPGIAVVDDLSFSPDGTRLVFWGAADGSTGGGSLFLLPVDGSAGPQKITTSAQDADPVWAPDGQHIVFRRVIAAEQSRIVVIAPDGTGERQLTSGSGIDQDPTWSPDGTMIAYKSNRPGSAATQGDHIWVMQSNGAGQRQLADGGGTATNAPAWGNR